MAPRAPSAIRARRSAPTSQRPWTRAELNRLPDDGNRYELLDGVLLVTPQASYVHQRVAFELAKLIDRYVVEHGVAHVVGPGAVPFGKNELQPDVQVIPGTPRARKWTECPAPILVIEVSSPSTRRRDLGAKLDAYLARAGVPTVWVVDHKKLEVHVAERGRATRIERQSIEWNAPGTPEPLRIDLAAFFKDVLGTDSR